MSRCLLVLMALVATVSAFNVPAAATTPARSRTGGIAMQKLPKGWKKVKSRSRPGEFSYQNTKTGQIFNQIPPSLLRRGGEFYDDEKDTTAKPLWQWDANRGGGEGGGIFDKVRGQYAEKTSASKLEAYYKNGKKTDGYVEASGFAANGEDLATVGGVYYLATVPFLLFFIAYIFGGIGSPYSGGGNFQ